MRTLLLLLALAAVLPGCASPADAPAAATSTPAAAAHSASPAAPAAAATRAPDTAAAQPGHASASGGATASPVAEPASAAAPPPVVPGAAHPHEAEIADIRLQHLKRLDAKLNVEPAVLRETCRYESDISTHPPLHRVALSFDDGPEPGQTEHILAVLARYRIPGAFFMVGEKMQRHPELVAQVRAAGLHQIGNHSWDHPNFHDIDPARQQEEIARVAPLLDASVPGGAMGTRLFRYPYGNASCEANDYAHAQGYRIVGWHVDSCDWAFEKTGAVDFREATSCGVLSQYHHDFVGHVLASVRARRGGIVLLHEIHPNTIRHLEDIILALRADGFTFGSLTDEAFASSLR